ncbi:MAG: YjbQ family protein, partial [Syntrophomonadaceae bacterium]|nr:YjbQ family protein [Syntrophomonadaceae bacterium]
MLYEFNLKTAPENLYDITQNVQEVIRESGVRD